MGAQLLLQFLGWTVTAPLQMWLQPPAAARTGWRVQGLLAQGVEVGAGFGQQHPAKGADPVSCCTPEPGTQ